MGAIGSLWTYKIVYLRFGLIVVLYSLIVPLLECTAIKRLRSDLSALDSRQPAIVPSASKVNYYT